MLQFHEFITKKEQLADLDGLLKALPKAYNLYQKLIAKFTLPTLREAFDIYKKFKGELNVEWFIKNVIDNEKFQDYMQSNYGAKVKRTIKEPEYDFGAEGIVFFFSKGICVKFNKHPELEDEQFDVACELAGELELVPIISCFEVVKDGTTIPAIVMKTLKVASGMFDRDVEKAYTALSYYLRNFIFDLMRRKEEISHAEVGSHLDFDNVLHGIKNPRERFGHTPKKITDLSPVAESAIRDLVTILKTVYMQTAYLFGADIESGRNLGLDPSSGAVLPFDLGIGVRTRKLSPPQRETLNLDFK